MFTCSPVRATLHAISILSISCAAKIKDTSCQDARFACQQPFCSRVQPVRFRLRMQPAAIRLTTLYAITAKGRDFTIFYLGALLVLMIMLSYTSSRLLRSTATFDLASAVIYYCYNNKTGRRCGISSPALQSALWRRHPV
jgi:hypothetical protein